jgi:hypothetical protein
MQETGILAALDMADLALAATGGFLVSYGAVHVSGFLPLGAAPGAGPRMLSSTLVVALLASLAGLAALLVGFILFEASWAPTLIAAGLAVLAAPPVFGALPEAWTGGNIGLIGLVIAAGALILVLGERLLH